MTHHLSRKILKEAFRLMATAREMTLIYEENFKQVSKYVHATSRGHEAIQIALGQQLTPQDFVFPYYRDDAMLLSIGLSPYELMLQLMAKRDDPFTGGRSYYSHPSLKDADRPKIPHQSSATGMQAIPAAGTALGIWYKRKMNLLSVDENPLVVCSLGDASVTEGEVSEAMQMAVLKKLPIMFLVQDNEWDISATAEETRAQNAAEFAKGFHGMKIYSIDGTDYPLCRSSVMDAFDHLRRDKGPVLLHAMVPLLNHHTSGVRMEWYRDDLEEDRKEDPFFPLKKLAESELGEREIKDILNKVKNRVKDDYKKASEAPDPEPAKLKTHIFAPTPITEEQGVRAPEGAESIVMVDGALLAIKELMTEHKECLLYGQDVGSRLGGVFREAATLAEKFGDHRVFNTPIQEAFIIGSTVGMSATGLKPIVEVQFADYIWPGLNQLFTEVSRSCFLSRGKYPVSMVLRVPIGAYGSGGPYHSSSVESVVANIKGLKIVYPSTAADMKGLMKAAWHDPNPVVIFEHKGLYWSKIPGTEEAKTPEPSEDYILPLGKGRVVTSQSGDPALTIITYGMGVYWSLRAIENVDENIEIIDLRSLYPLDTDLISTSVKRSHKALVVTEEPPNNSFAQALTGRIQRENFEYLDAPVCVIGSKEVPAIPLNESLEKATIPSAGKVETAVREILNY